MKNYGIELIKLFEGFSPTVYLCPAGYPTIGYGHVVQKGEEFSEITQAEAEELLQKDLAKYEAAVRRLISVPLSEDQFAALVSFTYNLGAAALQRSTIRAKLNRGEYEDIPDELMRWIWAGGRRLKGLVRRRMMEGLLFQGIYVNSIEVNLSQLELPYVAGSKNSNKANETTH